MLLCLENNVPANLLPTPLSYCETIIATPSCVPICIALSDGLVLQRLFSALEPSPAPHVGRGLVAVGPSTPRQKKKAPRTPTPDYVSSKHRTEPWASRRRLGICPPVVRISTQPQFRCRGRGFVNSTIPRNMEHGTTTHGHPDDSIPSDLFLNEASGQLSTEIAVSLGFSKPKVGVY